MKYLFPVLENSSKIQVQQSESAFSIAHISAVKTNFFTNFMP